MDEPPAEPPVGGEEVNPAPPGVPLITQTFGNISGFFAAYGWYIVAGFVIFSFVWKNLEEKIARFQRSIEDGRIKKDPDTVNRMEEERFNRLERLQKEFDEKAIIRKAREDEIAAEKAEREKLRQTLKLPDMRRRKLQRLAIPLLLERKRALPVPSNVEALLNEANTTR
ncbi:Oidioi.mRNA.OKI2018_I69.PAR.g12575.t1.cds [Oikopleura dioica]|uniref:Oidioi.mRNA.OKI2018_I69.PAR.g12575.t1.cds n=1 Tax=Oikopleura dioica TaxID=34765 RepID=A0ABN7S0M3_OIKDI|nr:Oidioi.mRNA.OKI2018_I69.PAR.g12575.t1.cds [Oikopleura dioica]